MYDVEIEASEDITEDEIENLKLLYTTPIGTIPMEREKGIDTSFISMPVESAKNLYSVEIIKKTRQYSDGIEVSSIAFASDSDGRIIAKVVIYRGE
jgi:uncharacterized protein